MTALSEFTDAGSAVKLRSAPDRGLPGFAVRLSAAAAPYCAEAEARVIAGHFPRLPGIGHGATAAKDFRHCAGFFGWGQMARLTGAGLVQMLRRQVTRQGA